MIITNLFKKPEQLNDGYKPDTYYHGFHAKEMFTYRCGYCNFPITKANTTCKCCGNKITWSESEVLK